MQRRDGLALLLVALSARAGSAERDDAIHRGRHLRFPADHGAHPGARIEWTVANARYPMAGTPRGVK